MNTAVREISVTEKAVGSKYASKTIQVALSFGREVEKESSSGCTPYGESEGFKHFRSSAVVLMAFDKAAEVFGFAQAPLSP